MTYNELILVYPWIDLFLEIFKGVGPTLVALWAIQANHMRAVKRDIKNRENALLYDIKKEMFNKFLILSQLQWEVGQSLIKYLSNIGDEKILEEYVQNNKIFLLKAREIDDYYYSVFCSFNVKIDCSEAVGVSQCYSNELNRIHEKYYNTIIGYSRPCQASDKLNKMSDEVLKTTLKMKDYTDDIMVQIAKSIKEHTENKTDVGIFHW